MRISRFWLRIFSFLLMVAIISVSLLTFWLWLDQPVQHIEINGNFKYIDPAELSVKLRSEVKNERWLSVNLNRLYQLILHQPWVYQVEIHRQWPKTLVFNITEQQPVAWFDGIFLLNADDQLFFPASSQTQLKLPYLSGPIERSYDILKAYQYLQAQLAPLKLVITALGMTERRAISFTVNDGFTVVLGHNAINERLQRLKVAWQQKLKGQQSQILSIDLRYPNGLAIGYH